MASHALHPGDYGRAFAVSTFFALLTRPSAAFARLVTWNTSRERAINGGHTTDSHTRDSDTKDSDTNDSGLLLRDMTRRLFLAGLIIAGLSILGGPGLDAYLHVPLSYIVVSAISVPFTLAGPPLIGKLQGQERFIPWSVLSLVVALTRLVFVAAFVYQLGALGFLIGITVASVITFLVTLAVVWPGMRGSANRFEWRPVIPFVVVAVASSITMSVFLAIDVVMVEHFFDKVRGGQYSVVAVLARSIFFATGGIASVQFPKVAARHARGLSTVGVVGSSLLLCVASGLIGSALLQVFGRALLRGFAGAGYAAGGRYIGWYGVGMMLLSCAVVLVNTQQSLNDPSLLWVLAPMTLLEPTLIFLFHHTLLTVVVASDVSIAVFVLVMGCLYMIGEHNRQRLLDGRRGDLDPSTPKTVSASFSAP